MSETRTQTDIQNGRFLRLDGRAELKAKLRMGELQIEPGGPNREAMVKAPDAMLQDWLGCMFMPRATIARMKALLQDYENYKNFYKPKVIESKLIDHRGDEYDIFLRLFEHSVLTVVLNTNYRVRYDQLDTQRLQVTSRSTRIAEVKNGRESPVGGGAGYLWRLNSYWRFEEADGGVYAECEAISLSRGVPFGLGWMLKGFVERFPKDSMLNTLRGTAAAAAQADQ